MRMHYDRGGIHMPELGEECYQSSPKIIKCTDHKLLFVQRNDEYGSPSPEFFCCCPAPCEEIATPGEAEYGRCYCFSGKVDFTEEACDMQFTAQLAGAAVGTVAGCSGPFVLNEVYVERGGANPTYCDWIYTTGSISESNEPCPEACPGNDDLGVPRQPRTCGTSIWIRCAYNPCGEKEYLAEVIVGKTELHSCGVCDRTPAILPALCTQSCGTLYFHIPSDPCGCPKKGTYNGYPYRFGEDDFWCINALGENPHACDPWGANPSHTLTLGAIHEETCKPFNCAAPPCAATDTGEI